MYHLNMCFIDKQPVECEIRQSILKRMGWVATVEMSHPTFKAAISPETKESSSPEQRSPLTPVQFPAPAKQHHVSRALSPSTALSSCPSPVGHS